MTLKEKLEFIQFTGDNEKELEKFSKGKVFVDNSMGWPAATVKFANERIAVFKDDYLAKHGDNYMSIPEDIIKFIMT